MNTLKLMLAAAVLFTGIPSPAMAAPEETAVRADMDASFRANIDLRRLELQKKLFKGDEKDARTTFQEALMRFRAAPPEERSTYRSEFRARFAERFALAAERLEGLQARMKTRIEAREEAGEDMSGAQKQLNASVSLMANIRTDIEKLEALLAEEYDAEERMEKREEARALVASIKGNIKASHQSLWAALMEMKAAGSVKAIIEAGADIYQ